MARLTTTRKRRANGSGTLIARNGRWAMKWFVDGRRVQELTEFRVDVKADRARAEQRLAERVEIFQLKRERDQLAVMIQRRESIEQRIRELQARAMPEEQPLMLGGLEAEWRASPRRRDCSPVMLERYAQQLRAFVEWAGEGVDFRVVGDELAECYAKSLGAKVSANTYNKHLNTLSAIWKSVGRVRRVGNPWADLPRKRLDTHVRRALTREEIAKAVEEAQGEWRALILIGARTGLRLGDACRLRWSDFGADGVLRITTHKTGAAVALPGAELLAELRATVDAEGELITPTLAALYARDDSAVSKGVRRILERAGIATRAHGERWGRARPEASFHSLRHAFVTRAIEAGVAAPIVRALVGHNTAAMTDRYTHVGEAAILEAFTRAAGRLPADEVAAMLGRPSKADAGPSNPDCPAHD